MPVAHSEFQKRSSPLAGLSVAIIFASLLTPAGRAIAGCKGTGSEIAGDWSGNSICQVANSPCQNEKVVYHITMAKETGKVTVAADKIVDGFPVNMGSIDFDYDEQKGILINKSGRGVWKFLIHGKRMDGTLTLPDATVYRKVTLSKEEKGQPRPSDSINSPRKLVSSTRKASRAPTIARPPTSW